jgi:hypothetical protein
MKSPIALTMIATAWAQPAFEIASVKPTPTAQQNQLKRECTNDRFTVAAMPLPWHITSV